MRCSARIRSIHAVAAIAFVGADSDAGALPGVAAIGTPGPGNDRIGQLSHQDGSAW
jgi:hypothetical protein